MVWFFILSILFLVLAIPLLIGLGGRVIAGFLALPAEELGGAGLKRLSRVFGAYLLLAAAGVFSLLFSRYFPLVTWLFAAAIVVATVSLVLWLRRNYSPK